MQKTPVFLILFVSYLYLLSCLLRFSLGNKYQHFCNSDLFYLHVVLEIKLS